MSDVQSYTLSISLETLKHLGIGLYSNIPAVISEVVANSYDADASWVRIEIDTAGGTILVIDDGWGMSRQDINDKYLSVGYNKRQNEKPFTPKGRLPMGRKGIGKLALFSIANTVEVHSVKKQEGRTIEQSGFVMTVEGIEAAIESRHPYHPDPVPLDTIAITEGTQISLRDLKLKPDATAAFLRRRLARRFSIIGIEQGFEVFVNGEPIGIDDRDYFKQIEYLWYFGVGSDKYVGYCVNSTHQMKLDGVVDAELKYEISGWIGTFHEQKQIDEGNNTIVVLARGKLVHEDILKDMKEAGIYAQYLIGEVRADFLDLDDKADIATSDRQSLKEDDPRFIKLKTFIQDKILKVIQSKWTDFRTLDSEQKALTLPVVKEWYENLSSDNKKWAKKLFAKIESFPIKDADYKKELYRHGILAFETLAVKQNLGLLDSISTEQDIENFKNILTGLDELEQVHYYQVVKGRMGILRKFEQLAAPDIKERIIQEHIFDHLWLLDPSWERASSNERMEQSLTKEFEAIRAGLTDEEIKARLDIRYKTAAGKHIIIELKRYDRQVSFMELVGQVEKYLRALTKCLQTHYTNEQHIIEIICLVGPKPTPQVNEERYIEVLKVLNARYITYDDLIVKTQQSYADYLEANAKISRIMELLDNL